MRDEQLIERLRRIFSTQDTTGFHVFDFFHSDGSPLQALFYSRLFWPEFIEIEGMIFLKETCEDQDDSQHIMEAFTRYGRDRRTTEQAFNLVEVPFLFGRCMGELIEEEYIVLGERLAEMWRCRLQMLFPQRHFSVEVLSPEQTGSEVGILFYQNFSEDASQ